VTCFLKKRKEVMTDKSVRLEIPCNYLDCTLGFVMRVTARPMSRCPHPPCRREYEGTSKVGSEIVLLSLWAFFSVIVEFHNCRPVKISRYSVSRGRKDFLPQEVSISKSYLSFFHPSGRLSILARFISIQSQEDPRNIFSFLLPPS